MTFKTEAPTVQIQTLAELTAGDPLLMPVGAELLQPAPQPSTATELAGNIAVANAMQEREAA